MVIIKAQTSTAAAALTLQLHTEVKSVFVKFYSRLLRMLLFKPYIQSIQPAGCGIQSTSCL